ncbi:MAG: cysteine desulfurase family protein [Deltaproteobacteria bacterium]
MKLREIYLDNSATTRPFDEIISNVGSGIEINYGNPSSLHSKGLESEKILKYSKQAAANSLGVSSGEIFFTSGGTESNNIALQGYVKANEKRLGCLVTSKIEHPSVLDVFKYFEKIGFKVYYLPVDKEGVIIIDELEKICQSQKVSLASIMHVNNEVGSVQPIEDIISLKKRYGFSLHVDAVQAYCKVKVSSFAKEIDFLSFSGHKIHALKGIGALYIKKGVRIEPLYYGGGQEDGIRPGTENILGIWSLGKAVEIFNKYDHQVLDKTRELKEYFVERILSEIADTGLNGTTNNEKSAPHIANLWFEGIPGEVMLHALEQKGIFASTGSACSSRKKTVSHVLKAMGIKDELAGSSVRFSLSILNTREELDCAIEGLKECVSFLRR